MKSAHVSISHVSPPTPLKNHRVLVVKGPPSEEYAIDIGEMAAVSSLAYNADTIVLTRCVVALLSRAVDHGVDLLPVRAAHFPGIQSTTSIYSTRTLFIQNSPNSCYWTLAANRRNSMI